LLNSNWSEAFSRDKDLSKGFVGAALFSLATFAYTSLINFSSGVANAAFDFEITAPANCPDPASDCPITVEAMVSEISEASVRKSDLFFMI
jgi:hypothetical protein